MSAYVPEYIEVETVADYCKFVREALYYWLMIHTDPETWAQQWLVDDTPNQAMMQSKGTLKHNFFEFNWLEAAIRKLAQSNDTGLEICDGCRSICFAGDDSCRCEEDDEQKNHREVNIEKEDELGLFVDFARDCGIDIPDAIVMNALRDDGFPVYAEAMDSYISYVAAEVKEVIEKIDDAETPEDKIAAVLWGTRVYHVHGKIMEDYGCQFSSFDEDDIDKIRNNGLAAVFSKEQIEAFLLQEA